MKPDLATFAIIKPTQIDYIWPKCKAYLQAAIDRDPGENLTLDWVYQHLKDGVWMLSTARQGRKIIAAVVSKIAQYQNTRRCLIVLCGGEKGKITTYLPLVRYIEEWAKDNGASNIRIMGRKGWARALGWDEQGIIIGKNLI